MKIKKSNLRILMIFFISLMFILQIDTVPVSVASNAPYIRLCGSDRYATSASISREGWVSSEYVLLATGEGDDKFADALAGAPLAGALDAPVLLTETNSLSYDTRLEIERLRPNMVYILGGTGVISDNIRLEVENMGIAVERLWGSDRYATAARIAETLNRYKIFSKAVITTGSEFQYAMMSAPFAAMDGFPVLFTTRDNISEQTKGVLKTLNIKNVEIIGGYDIVSSFSEDELIRIGIAVTRTAGAGILGTNIDMIRKHMPFPDNICIARNDLFADSLSGVPYGARMNAPILLVDSNNASIDVSSFISSLSVNKVFVFGGAGAVSDDVVNSICSRKSSNKLYGLNFSPYIDGQDPNINSTVSEDQIRSRMKIAAPYTMWIRTYSCTGGVENSGSIAHELGLNAALGAWIGRDREANGREILNLIEEVKSGNADMAIVGNEVLLRGDVSEDELIGYINDVRDAARINGIYIPVAAVETYSELLKHPKLMEACDVILANYHPYWEGKAIEDAVSSFDNIYGQLISAAGGKKIIISETGWPDGGNANNKAVPSQENAKEYLNEFTSYAQSNGIPYFYFEAFDESWKAGYEGTAGSHWGLWDSSGNSKYDIKSILNRPSIKFTYLPPIGSQDYLEGNALNIEPDQYKIAVYIKVSGRWWTKPYADTPLTEILPDGTWSCDITTGGIDSTASSIAAFLIPSSYSPPLLIGSSSLPDELNIYSKAKVIVER